MEPEFDLRRLRDLQTRLDSKLPAIVATLLAELTRAADQLQTATRTGDWVGAEHAAHAGRNSALMLDARPLLGAYDQAELAARQANPSAAHLASARVQLLWPALRARLEAVAQDRD